MAQETDSEAFYNEFLKVVNSEEDFLEILKHESEEFNFSFIRFNVDIDLYSLIAKNPISSISLLSNERGSSRPRSLKELDPIFDCSNVCFSKPVIFFESIFHVPARFINAIFSKGFNFRKARFKKSLFMNNVSAEIASSFGFISCSSVTLLNCRFAAVDNRFTEVSTEGNFHIENTIVGSELNLSRCKVKGQLNLIGTTILGRLDLSQSIVNTFNVGNIRNPQTLTELNDLNIDEAEFEQQVNFSQLNVNGKVQANASVFRGNVFFTDVNFNNHVYLSYSMIDKSIYFKNVTAKRNFSFYGATINADLNFDEVDFSSANISFTGSRINCGLWLGSLLHKGAKEFTGEINFQGATVTSDSVIRIFNLNKAGMSAGKINFSNVLMKGLLDIQNVFVKEITLKGTVVPGNVQTNNLILSAIADRETARLLKHEARKINNNISALSYNKIEMRLYAKDLPIRAFADWSMLQLNRISNNYGTNWLRGAGFTIGSSLICYTLFNIFKLGFGFFWAENWNFLYNDAWFWSSFINYFWLPTGFNELTKNGNVNGGFLGGLTFVIGKILIAYGIYQTVAAFRKHIH